MQCNAAAAADNHDTESADADDSVENASQGPADHNQCAGNNIFICRPAIPIDQMWGANVANMDCSTLPSKAGTFRKKLQKNSGKIPDSLSELFLEFSSRVQLGTPKP